MNITSTSDDSGATALGTVTTPSSIGQNKAKSLSDVATKTATQSESTISSTFRRTSITGDDFTPATSTPKKSASIRLLRTHSLAAVNSTSDLVVARENDDFIAQFEHGNDLRKHLKVMWDNRQGRERKWGRLLNSLQTAIAKVEFDLISLDAANGILVVVEMLAHPVVEDEDILNAKRHLTEANLDHWAAISAEKANEFEEPAE